uniref:Forkhead box protein O n=1 Tax=Anisakis simplex TaxID=6269 RepID=A0A2R4KQY7_ANISI|nr:daf-16 [Anisakis simplex]
MESIARNGSICAYDDELESESESESESRSRCYTWPMQQLCSVSTTNKPTDPPPPVLHASTDRQLPSSDHLLDNLSHRRTATIASTATSPHLIHNDISSLCSASDGGNLSSPLLTIQKKRVRKRTTDQVANQKKPNPWGEESYSDLIAKALECAPEKRMKLNEIYLWFSTNISYFRDKSSTEEAAGWKNSIRHNLSLHSRFMRIQNEGAGKSSWWVINPDAKPGRNPRRQRSATLENTTKAAIEKKRRGARKKAMELRAAGTLHSASSSVVGSQASIISHELYGDNDDSLGNFEPLFRPRTQSNLSITASSSRVSPSMTTDHFDDFDFPPFVEAGAMPHDILDRTNEMNLNTHPESSVFQRAGHNPMLNGSPSAASSSSSASSLLQHIKSEPTPPNSIKNEANGVQPPPSYHELNAVRGVSHLQNPLLRTHLIQNRLPPPAGLPYNGLYSTATGTALPNWIHTGGAQLIPGLHSQISCSAQQTLGPTAALPLDLENLTLPDQPLMELDNMEAVLRHELSQSTSNQLSFDNI